MKKIILLLLVIAGMKSYAQCDKSYVLNSSKTEYVNGNNELQRTVDENTTIEINKTEITITPGAAENKMTGTIKTVACDWKQPFKTGKTVIKAALTDPGGEAKNVTITIEGKEGKLTLLAQVDDDPDRKIRITIDKFEEKG